MAKLQSTENASREMQQQSTEQASHKRLCKRNRFFSCSWRTRQRRGVLLLVSLVLLVMFLMLGVTFVLTAGNFRRSSEAYQRMLERPSADLPERSGDLLDSVARDLVRGTTNPNSPFAKENLLEDLYGQPALRGMLSAAPSNSVAQLAELTVTADADFTVSSVRDYYAGLVLTFLTGGAAGKSARVVASNGSTLTIVALAEGVTPSMDDLFLVNGRPFSGDGSGQDDGSGAAGTATPRRLNEDYDAADVNNPWLASMRGTGVRASWDNAFKWGDNTDSELRPYGSTPSVDNDGDGEKDSIWIDAGLPLQIQPDGSYVKPLVAMLVRDLGGRVNLNVHGSAAQLSAMASADKPLGQGYGPAEIDPWHALNIKEDGTEFDIDQFLNLRLHDTNLPPDGSEPPTGSDDQQDFLNYYQYGSEAAVVTPLDPHGRAYAEADATTGAITWKTVDGNGLTDDFSGTTYALEVDTAQGVAPGWHTPYAPNDLERILRFSDADADAIDSRLYEDLALCLTGDTEIDPDDLKTLRERITTESWDLPVAGLSLPRELYSKVDNLINDLLLSDENKTKLQKFLLAGGHITDLLKARILLENPDYQNAPLQDKLNDLTDQNFDSDFPSVRVAIESFVAQLPGLGPGLTRGTRFNVNRLFGNGEDDDGNGVVDDVGEVGTEEIDAPGYENPNNPGGYELFDHDGNGTAGEDNDKRARQHYAQQLYLLLMLLSDSVEDNVPAPSGAIPDEKRKLLARRLAQFAVNAADYRDADAIMTSFEYDANPFDADGWLAEAEGDLSTVPADISEYGVVWGCEAPMAALSGTLALHDLRLKDLEAPGGKTTDFEQTNAGDSTLSESLDPDLDYPLTFKDDDYDQYAPPEGSLFLQIYAIPQPAATKRPSEFFTSSGSDGQLELSKTTPGGDPLWRVAISEPHPVGLTGQTRSGPGSPILNQLMDQDGSGDELSETELAGSLWNPLTTIQPKASDPAVLQLRTTGINSGSVDDNVQLDRVVYFTSSTGNAPPLNEAYLNQDGDIQLAPGSATIAGPRQTTKIRSGGVEADSIASSTVCTSATTPSGWSGSEPVGMSVSEPVTSNYYNEIGDAGEALVRIADPLDPDGEVYEIAADAPLDKPLAATGSSPPVDDLITSSPLLLESNRVDTITDDSGNAVDIDRPQLGGKINNYCTAFLQRLADPTQDYDATTNPYITVDLMPIDLTVYNGEDTSSAAVVSSMNAPSSGSTYTNSQQSPDNPGWRSRQEFSDVAGTVTSSTSINPPTAFVSLSHPAPFWPNRPFVSQYELLMVPASEPAKLSLELGPHSGDPQANFTEGFPHLLNFFFESTSADPGPRLGRAFDYLHVPSKYAGTQVSLDPGTLKDVAGFAPPFNVISTYREPGRVNLNTIEGQKVWDAVMNGASADATRHQAADFASLESTAATQPFRGAGYTEQSGTPLTATALPPLNVNLSFENTAETANPFLRFQPINRMGNLTTTRSNVYAVWMTLGFFETDETGAIKQDADGNLAGESGNETERHRAFYMIDRSIPVGYENGHDHNTQDVFRVKRYIE